MKPMRVIIPSHIPRRKPIYQIRTSNRRKPMRRKVADTLIIHITRSEMSATRAILILTGPHMESLGATFLLVAETLT
jgi:hypothetical protein